MSGMCRDTKRRELNIAERRTVQGAVPILAVNEAQLIHVDLNRA